MTAWLAGLTFTTPLALGALALLPAIWWLLRALPPRPRSVRFAPFRLLLDLVSREQESEHTPWWLLALRLALAGVVIFAVAGPMIDRSAPLVSGASPTLLIIDDGWAAAARWQARLDRAAAVIAAAERTGQPLALATTVKRARPVDIEMTTAQTVRRRLAALQPAAMAPDHRALAARLQRAYATADALDVVWLADGFDDAGQGGEFLAGLRQLAGGRARVHAVVPETADLPLALARPQIVDGKFKVRALRAPEPQPRQAKIVLTARNGRSLAAHRIAFAAGAREANIDIALPLELRNEIAFARIASADHAGAVYLFDDRWRRKTVALLSGASLEFDQPLLSPLYYVANALEPAAEIVRPRDEAQLNRRLKAGLSVLVLADIGVIAKTRRQAIVEWIKRGGILVRFAGPRLAGGNDDLVPVKLRRGGRQLGSALSWQKPQGLAEFDNAGPFRDLKPDTAVKVRRQVLAEPASDLAGRVWARLADGTPLVTAAARGNGMIVLFHVTANATWSNLPLSGLFVDMLTRIVDLAPGAGAMAERTGPPITATAIGKTVLAPYRTLDGFGRLVSPPPQALPLPARGIDKVRPQPRHPAGLYRAANVLRAVNLDITGQSVRPLIAPAVGVSVSGYDNADTLALSGWLFAVALALFVADCLAVMTLANVWRRLRPAAAAAALIIVFLFAVAGGRAVAQDASTNTSATKEAFALRHALTTSIAYVVTGQGDVDETSRAGLVGLGDVLRSRTSIEPGPPAAIDIERDEIVFFPLIYWPVLPTSRPLSVLAAAKVDTYMKNGGTIFFDTRDADAANFAVAGQVTPATRALRAILDKLDIPPIEPVPARHVLTKAFYLLQTFPGKFATGRLWVESTAGANRSGNSDGVSSIIIGANDYAAAWAVDGAGQPLYPVSPGGQRQREFARRVGVNIVMYALTGNYKADQVHVPALLERLGQ